MDLVDGETAPGHSDRLEILVGKGERFSRARSHVRGPRQRRIGFVGHLSPPRPEDNRISWVAAKLFLDLPAIQVILN